MAFGKPGFTLPGFLHWVFLLLSVGMAAAGLTEIFAAQSVGLQSDVARTYLTGAAFFFGVFAFFHNAKANRNQARQQYTLKLIFDTRLSTEFRRHLENRKLYFSEGEAVSDAKFRALLKPQGSTEMSGDEVERRRRCGESIRALLNYYEFVALGIYRKDLDGAMVKGALRTIMCSLVVDMKDVIDGYRAQNPRIYTNLVRLYMAWKRPDQPAFAMPTRDRLGDARRWLAAQITPSA